MRQQPMPACDIDDPSASTPSPHATRDLPRFVELLARQAAGPTHRPSEAVEQRLAGEAPEVVVAEPPAGAGVEAHGQAYLSMRAQLPTPNSQLPTPNAQLQEKLCEETQDTPAAAELEPRSGLSYDRPRRCRGRKTGRTSLF